MGINIFEIYTKKEIEEKCEVSETTPYNWEEKNSMPMWAIERFDLELSRKGYTETLEKENKDLKGAVTYLEGKQSKVL